MRAPTIKTVGKSRLRTGDSYGFLRKPLNDSVGNMCVGATSGRQPKTELNFSSVLKYTL